MSLQALETAYKAQLGKLSDTSSSVAHTVSKNANSLYNWLTDWSGGWGVVLGKVVTIVVVLAVIALLTHVGYRLFKGSPKEQTTSEYRIQPSVQQEDTTLANTLKPIKVPGTRYAAFEDDVY